MKGPQQLFIFFIFCVFFIYKATGNQCYYESNQRVNYTLCSPDPQQFQWCGPQATVPVIMDDAFTKCGSASAHCVQPPSSPSAPSPSCVPDPSQDPSRATCSYLKHTVPFEINPSLYIVGFVTPLTYLAYFSQDGLAISDMKTETIIYDSPISYANDILDISVVSSNNFIYQAYIVVLTTTDIIVYTAQVTDDTFGDTPVNFTLTNCSVSHNGINMMDTSFEPRSSTTWVMGLDSSSTVSFYEINPNTFCPVLSKQWKLVGDNTVDASKINNVKFLLQIEPDHDAFLFVGCYPPLSTRTLVYLNSDTQIFVYGFDGNRTNTSTSLTLSTDSLNFVYDVTAAFPNAKITAITAFGECFGNTDRDSQMLWLSYILWDGTTSTINVISLDEFSLVDFSCDDNDTNWWLHPSIYRDENCSAIENYCNNTMLYAYNETECNPRTTGFPITLQGPQDHIAYRFTTSPYNGALSDIPTKYKDFVHMFFTWQSESINVTIQGFQEVLCNDTSPNNTFIFQSFTNITSGRPINSVHLSENGQHMFVSYIKEQWEISSHSRFIDICSILTNSTNSTNSNNSSQSCSTYEQPTQSTFLAPYNSSCTSLQPVPFDAFDYLLYYSPCNGGADCHRYGNVKDSTIADFQNTYADFPDASTFAPRPTATYTCDAGFFCPGYGAKYECLQGTICPTAGLSRPSSCPYNQNFDTTCVYSRLTAPVPCPDGMVCLTQSSAPIPAPPGYYVTENGRNNFYPCEAGDWCALQRFNVSTTGQVTSLDCVAGTYCSNTTAMTPVPCSMQLYPVDGKNYTEYCPVGTVVPSPCPAGYYCQTPLNMTACDSTYYCPAGSQQQSLCPAGFFCKTPAVKVQCPSGHYCREGFTDPEKCHPLVVCPAGTSSEKFAISGILFDMGIVGVLLLAYFLGLKLRDRLRQKRDAARVLYVPLDKEKSQIQLKKKQHTITFGFENMGLELHGSKKKVLDGVTGTIRHSRVTAVMGPSGAGKTTFLTTLAGKASYGERTGTVLINGEADDIQKYKKILGFVPQEDIMHRELTVKEIIRFNAEVRLPSHLSSKEKADITNEVIQVLGLWDIRHQVIGDEDTRGISGGQRKRVNIGMELVADPTVIFLDEPTSGLDSTSSAEVVSCLRKVADLGLTIVTVLHQPRYEIFQLFHDVLLLGKGGKTVYIGPSEEALGYFASIGFKCPEHTNPPDFFMDVISGHIPREGYANFEPHQLFELWENRETKSESYQNSTQHIQKTTRVSTSDSAETPSDSTPLLAKDKTGKADRNRQTAGFFKQLILFTFRALIQQVRDMKGFFWDNMLIVIAGTLLGALYIGTPYKGPVSAALQQMCPAFMQKACQLPQTDKLNAMATLVSLSLGFTAMAASLRCFGTEKVIFWRESASGINKVAYFMGKNLAQMINITLAPIVFLSVFYTLTSPRATVWHYYQVLFLLQFAMVGIGYLISITMPYKNAQLTGVVIALVFAMFGGVNPTLAQLKANKITYAICSLSPNRWTDEALYVIEIKRYKEIYDISSSLELWGYEEDGVWIDLLVLFGMGMIARFFALICLTFLNRDKMK